MTSVQGMIMGFILGLGVSCLIFISEITTLSWVNIKKLWKVILYG